MRSVVIIDDHQVFAELLSLALQGEPDIDCVGHAQNVTEGVALVERLQPDIVVMDVKIGDGDGVAATEELTGRFPDLCVVVLTAFVEQRLMQRAASANACALLPKDGDLDGMLTTLRTAKRGSFAVHPELLHRLVARREIPRQRPPDLTPREQEVLDLLAAGLDTRLIARELGISLNTCRGYVKSLLSKLGAHSQLEAVAIAIRHGLVDVHSST